MILNKNTQSFNENKIIRNIEHSDKKKIGGQK